MQLIGDRISILEKEKELSIVILSYRHPFKNILIISWMLLFTFCGVLAFREFIGAVEHDRRIFWMVFIGFWVYFEVSVLKACLWRWRGKEKILMSPGILKIKREVSGLESYKEYRMEQTGNWKRIIPDNRSISGFYENAYWFVGGERISFDFQGQEIGLGLQLKDEDVNELVRKLKHSYRFFINT